MAVAFLKTMLSCILSTSLFLRRLLWLLFFAANFVLGIYWMVQMSLELARNPTAVGRHGTGYNATNVPFPKGHAGLNGNLKRSKFVEVERYFMCFKKGWKYALLQ